VGLSRLFGVSRRPLAQIQNLVDCVLETKDLQTTEAKLVGYVPEKRRNIRKIIRRQKISRYKLEMQRWRTMLVVCRALGAAYFPIKAGAPKAAATDFSKSQAEAFEDCSLCSALKAEILKSPNTYLSDISSRSRPPRWPCLCARVSLRDRFLAPDRKLLEAPWMVSCSFRCSS
jgi:hypothetical protein